MISYTLIMQALRLLCSVLLILLMLACQGNQSRGEKEKVASQSGVQSASVRVPDFNPERAFQYLVAQTDFGPRAPNSDGHRACLHYLETELRRLADAVNLQYFTHPGYDGKTLQLTNVIASFNLGAAKRILLCAHWDTRPWADLDPNLQNRSRPILGANDGASGVAVLLEIAHHLKETPPPVGVDIILFDGEDYGRAGDLDNYLLGSKFFARTKPEGFRPLYGILVDMVGDAQLEIPKERNSVRFAPDLVNKVWTIARNVGSGAFIDAIGEEVYDDHIPLNQVGIRTINIIDFSYPDESHRYWHTLQDTPDRCSPESLAQVGRVLLHLIYRHAL